MKTLQGPISKGRNDTLLVVHRCVLVRGDAVVARGSNMTNESRNVRCTLIPPLIFSTLHSSGSVINCELSMVLCGMYFMTSAQYLNPLHWGSITNAKLAERIRVYNYLHADTESYTIWIYIRTGNSPRWIRGCWWAVGCLWGGLPGSRLPWVSCPNTIKLHNMFLLSSLAAHRRMPWDHVPHTALFRQPFFKPNLVERALCEVFRLIWGP